MAWQGGASLLLLSVVVLWTLHGGNASHVQEAFATVAGLPTSFSTGSSRARVGRKGAAIQPCWKDSKAARLSCGSPARSNRKPLGYGAASATCVIDVEGTRTEAEVIGNLMGSGEVCVTVREAKIGEGDAVALLRCR